MADGGQALGTVGAVQGDTRFGDVRIAAAPQSSGLVANAAPFSWSGTTLSGDVVFNANYPFRTGNVRRHVRHLSPSPCTRPGTCSGWTTRTRPARR